MKVKKAKEKRPLLTKKEFKNAALSVIAAVILLVAILVLNYVVINRQPFSMSFVLSMAGIAFIYLTILSFFAVYIFFVKREYLCNFNKVFSVYIIIVVSNLVFVLMDIVSFYAIPISLGSTLIVLLVDRELAFLSSFCLFIIFFCTFLIDSTVESMTDVVAFMLSGIIMSIIMLFFTKKSIKRLNVFLVGLLVSLMPFIIISLFNLTVRQDFSNLLHMLPYLALGSVGGVILVMIIQPLFEVVFNLVTDIRLLELTDYKHPLLQRLSSQAPGTFHHSLTVANLAETCAAAIGENVYFARAAAIYHDVGKLKAPLYYKENQSEYNPHDELTPEASVNVLAQHTVYGNKIAQEYRIPEQIRAIAIEHHGTMPIAYFFHKAQEMTENVLDINHYRYPGPLPGSKVAAIVMICDASEAAVRTLQMPTGEKIDKMIKSIIDARLSSGQFDNCDITMNDLYKIRQTLNTAFAALYHQRIEYPDQKKSD